MLSHLKFPLADFSPPTNGLRAPVVSVEEATEITRPSQLRHLWHSLWSRTPRASFRQTPEFLEATTDTIIPARALFTQPFDQRSHQPSSQFCKHDSSPDRWRIFIVSAWQRPIGILPLQQKKLRSPLGVEHVLALPQSFWGACPGAIGPHPTTTLAAVLRHLALSEKSWDRLELPEVVVSGVKTTRLATAVGLRGTLFRKSRDEVLGLELPISFSQFWADRDAIARQRWRELQIDRLRCDGQLVRFRPGGTANGDTNRNWHLLNEVEEIVRLQAGLPHSEFAGEMFQKLRRLHRSAVDAGAADIALWLENSRPTAFAYNFHCRTRTETALLLADPRFPHATDRLIGMMLRDQIGRGDTWHAFLPNSVLGKGLDPLMWQPIRLCETTVSRDRAVTIRSRLRHWWNGERKITSASCC